MKHIILIYDGTGESTNRSKVESNIRRLFLALPENPTIQRVFKYQRGVGTDDIDKGDSLGMFWRLIQGISGKGLKDHVISGYQWVIDNYQPGDEIFIFGFSRGAFAARVIANIIARLGVIDKEDSWALPEAMRAYKVGTLDAYASHCRSPNEGPGDAPRSNKVEIAVVGCWDTVASMGSLYNSLSNPGGLSKRYRYLDGGLVQGIRHAFHALALDERRAPFTPTLWQLPADSEHIDLRQCWFPGVHSNVGGAYPDRALGNLTLAWMIDQCDGLLEFDQEKLDHIIRLDRDPSQVQNYRNHAGKKKKFDSEYQGWARGMWYDSCRGPLGWLWPRKHRIPGGYSQGGTGESMHASVRERWESSRRLGQGLNTGPPVWDPMSLKGFELREVAGKWEWVKRHANGEGTIVIPEFTFPTEESSFEYRLRNNVFSSSSPR